jgi:hypothetical protein
MKKILIIGFFLSLMACESEPKNVTEKDVKVDNSSKKDSGTLKPENEATHDTVRYTYTGRVGKLPIRCTLFFARNIKEDHYEQNFYGSYYYTTYKPNEIYKLKGGFAIALGCLMPNDDEKKQEEFKDFSPIRLSLQEYTNQENTATISVCYKKDMSYMKGSMYNYTDGRSFEFILEKQ